MATSNPLVFAAGDVTPLPVCLRCSAVRKHRNPTRPLWHRKDHRPHDDAQGHFHDTTIASVGITEAEARERRKSPMVSILPLEIVPRALVDQATTGLIKGVKVFHFPSEGLVADSRDGRLLGAHILAENAGEVIQAAVMAIKYRAKVDDIADTFHPYLTMAEGLKLAARVSPKV